MINIKRRRGERGAKLKEMTFWVLGTGNTPSCVLIFALSCLFVFVCLFVCLVPCSRGAMIHFQRALLLILLVHCLFVV